MPVLARLKKVDDLDTTFAQVDNNSVAHENTASPSFIKKNEFEKLISEFLSVREVFQERQQAIQVNEKQLDAIAKSMNELDIIPATYTSKLNDDLQELIDKKKYDTMLNMNRSIDKIDTTIDDAEERLRDQIGYGSVFGKYNYMGVPCDEDDAYEAALMQYRKEHEPNHLEVLLQTYNEEAEKAWALSRTYGDGPYYEKNFDVYGDLKDVTDFDKDADSFTYLEKLYEQIKIAFNKIDLPDYLLLALPLNETISNPSYALHNIVNYLDYFSSSHCRVVGSLIKMAIHMSNGNSVYTDEECYVLLKSINQYMNISPKSQDFMMNLMNCTDYCFKLLLDKIKLKGFTEREYDVQLSKFKLSSDNIKIKFQTTNLVIADLKKYSNNVSAFDSQQKQKGEFLYDFMSAVIQLSKQKDYSGDYVELEAFNNSVDIYLKNFNFTHLMKNQTFKESVDIIPKDATTDYHLKKVWRKMSDEFYTVKEMINKTKKIALCLFVSRVLQNREHISEISTAIKKSPLIPETPAYFQSESCLKSLNKITEVKLKANTPAKVYKKVSLLSIDLQNWSLPSNHEMYELFSKDFFFNELDQVIADFKIPETQFNIGAVKTLFKEQVG